MLWSFHPGANTALALFKRRSAGKKNADLVDSSLVCGSSTVLIKVTHPEIYGWLMDVPSRLTHQRLWELINKTKGWSPLVCALPLTHDCHPHWHAIVLLRTPPIIPRLIIAKSGVFTERRLIQTRPFFFHPFLFYLSKASVRYPLLRICALVCWWQSNISSTRTNLCSEKAMHKVNKCIRTKYLHS